MAEPFVTCWLETRTGTKYQVPDMLPEHVDQVARSLDQDMDTITVVNVSGVVVIFPKRILAKVGSGDRCFWEVSCTKLNPPGPYQKD
jgi:hypothetical protein